MQRPEMYPICPVCGHAKHLVVTDFETNVHCAVHWVPGDKPLLDMTGFLPTEREHVAKYVRSVKDITSKL
jgi:hypothetical protein